MVAGQSLPAALAAALARVRPTTGTWPPGSRSAVQHIAFTTARKLGAARFVLEAMAPRAPAAAVAALAHVALAQLLEPRRPDAVVVDQTIAAARRDRALAAAAAFLNAVLRRFVRERAQWLENIARNESARWNHPQWWIDQVRADHPDSWQHVLELAQRPPPMTLRINRRATTQQAYLQQLANAGLDAEPIGDDGVVLAAPCDVAVLPGFAAGLASVQDWGAQLAAPLLDPQEGQRVLDACAAPGGKSAHLLERADVDLLALDIDAARLGRVGQNLSRLRLAAVVPAAHAATDRSDWKTSSGHMVRLRAADAARPEQWWDGQAFDRILLDAPCSASGIVRRHPDVRWLRRRGDAATLSRIQAQLLAALWPLVAPGGKLLYATCSVFRAENACTVERFVSTASHCRLACDPLELLPTDAPGRQHDGFFYALLEKTP